MSTISSAEKMSVLDSPLLIEDETVIGWVDPGSIALCEFPIEGAYEKVIGTIAAFGFVDTMSQYRHGGIGQKPSHTSSVVRDILYDYHNTVISAFGNDWLRVQTTMRLDKNVSRTRNSPFHVDGVNVSRPDYTFNSDQKIVGITAYPNPTEFLPRGTVILGSIPDIFVGGNIRNHGDISAEPLSHPSKIALFGYSESFHREPQPAAELLGTPRLILRSFITT